MPIHHPHRRACPGCRTFFSSPARGRAIARLLACGIALACSAGLAATAPERTPRYRPEGTDFVIENGKSFFNRPLYGGNTGFRIEAGDRPEFAFHFPGRAGNVRIGILTKDSAKGLWAFDAKSVVTRYRPGSMIHEIRDPLLGNGRLTLTGIPAAKGEGFALRAELAAGTPPVRLVWAFGGSDGNKGRRNGDLNAENEPLDRFFAFTPERAKGGRFDLQPAGFTFTGKAGRLHCLSQGSKPQLADAANWGGPAALLRSGGSDNPVVAGGFDLTPSAAFHLAFLRDSPPAADPARFFAEAEVRRRSIAEQVTVRTPDTFLNAATAALNIAADAIWDEEKHTYMHGAVGWRVPLLGWRGPYAGDAFGHHDRTRRHIEGFAARQITTPPPAKLPPADGKYHLSRSETALNSNGNFIGDFIPFYDMNTVAVDAMFRHLLWTGDRDTAARFWPVLERHLAWQKRLFRRPFPDDTSPLYEAYACIWASDQLMYSGGGATHSSSYQYWHHRMAARLARWLGKDPAPYDREADAIARTMRRELWLTDRGWFAEYKDYLGLKLVHPSAALWTFYHTLDSEAATPAEAWQMSRFVDTAFPKIPMRVTGDPDSGFQLPTTDWHPYMWSINNVALAESAHTALGLWQCGRDEVAWPLMKGALLESMFLGPCPGNAGMTTPSDVFSKERYRDFADGAGISARAIVEGLFGIRPDRIAGELLIRPGFPASWNHASIKHPDLAFAFKREDLKESFAIDPRFRKPVALRLRVPALRDSIAKATVNGVPAAWKCLPDAVGHPIVEITSPPAPSHRVVIEWKGTIPSRIRLPRIVAAGHPFTADAGAAAISSIEDPQDFLKETRVAGHTLHAVADGTAGHRTAFAKVSQGDLSWRAALETELRAPFEIVSSGIQSPADLRFRLRNHTARNLSGPCGVSIGERTTTLEIAADAGRDSAEILLPADGLAPGSHQVSIDLPGGGRVTGTIVNWKLDPGPSALKWTPVDLSSRFNDKVTRIFQNEYLSPRSPFCSLAIPKHGIGGWCVFDPKVEIDDSGLRANARENGGIHRSSLGIPFATPPQDGANNILFTSQWDNHPREAVIPLGGRASRICLLMAGSTNPMQSRIDNGEVIVTYADGSKANLILRNPTTWWPIDQDYFIDDFAYQRPEPAPPRIDLKTGAVRVLEPRGFKSRSLNIPGGAATVLDLPLDPGKELRSLTIRAIANDVVIGLMAATLGSPER